MSNAEALEVLALAHALVDAGWTQGAMARLPWGEDVYATHRGAMRFCASGALWRALCETAPRGFLSALVFETQCTVLQGLLRDSLSIHYASVEEYNDDPRRRKRDVLRLIERAAAKVGK